MQTGWLKRAGSHAVEHYPCPHPGVPVDMDAPPAGCLHTIEGSLESGLAVFRQHFAPTFPAGRDVSGQLRLLQHVPLGYIASALENDPGGVETNRLFRVQIEVAGFSKLEPWVPTWPLRSATIDEGMLGLLADLFATLESACGIPLSRPWPDTLKSGLVWATEGNPRRIAKGAKQPFGRVPGWYAHVDVPENAHWDTGSLRVSTLLDLARSRTVEKPKAKPKPRPLAKIRWNVKARRLDPDGTLAASACPCRPKRPV